MSLSDWLRNGWLVEHKPSTPETRNLLGIADRDLRECELPGLSADWKLNIAYNAALQLGTVALAAEGYRATRESHHYRAIQSLEYTLGWTPAQVAELDRFRKKRNISDYDRAEAVSELEAKRMITIAQGLRHQVEGWLRSKHQSLVG